MWITTDRTMLEEKECTASTFIDALLGKIHKLTNLQTHAESKYEVRKSLNCPRVSVINGE
jgi:hypothetical protein